MEKEDLYFIVFLAMIISIYLIYWLLSPLLAEQFCAKQGGKAMYTWIGTYMGCII